MPEQTRRTKPVREDSNKLTWEQSRDIARRDTQRQESQREKSKDSPSSHTDEVLEAIDEALEDILSVESAESFVTAFQQHGGQ